MTPQEMDLSIGVQWNAPMIINLSFLKLLELISTFNATFYVIKCWLTSTNFNNFNMALHTGFNLGCRESMFIKVGISAASAKIYTLSFSSEEITRKSLHMLDPAMLKDLDIKTMDDVLTILKLTKETSVSPASHIKQPFAKLPQLRNDHTTAPKIQDRLGHCTCL